MSDRTLGDRLIKFSIGWIALGLLGTGLVLAYVYEQHVTQHYDAHVITHVEELVASMETDDLGRHRIVREPTDPRFYQKNSGWYWAVLHDDEVLQQSASLGEGQLQILDSGANENHGVQSAIGPRGEPLRAHVMHVSYPHDPGLLTFAATVPEVSIGDDVQDFAMHILGSFLVLGLMMALVVILQVRLALKPLRAIESSIVAVKSGMAKRLPDGFPADVQPLVSEMNRLLEHNETLLRRARNQLSDLAHTVKSPLSVIRNEARKMDTPEGRMILDHAHATAHSIDHCLTRARIFGTPDAMGYRTSVKSAIEDLRYVMAQVHRERNIETCFDCTGEKWFRGDAQDLEEMIGNLLDNGCKWAQSKVVVDCEQVEDCLNITIEDDGPGIPPEDVHRVMSRGTKLDPDKAGYGQGLAIVKDIATLYGGSLSLSRSALGGLKATLNLPSA